MRQIKRKVAVGVAALVLVFGGSSFAFAVSTLGGDWYYGTNYLTGNATTSFYHGSAYHWTSIGTSSGKYTRATGKAGETASTWLWRTPGSSVTFKAGANGKTVTK